MNTPFSIPLSAQLVVDDFQEHLKHVKGLLSKKLDMLQRLESTDLIANEPSFRKYKAIRDELDILIPFIKTTEIAMESLCEDATKCPVQLPHYQKLLIENHRLADLNQTLEQQNELLTDLLLKNGKR